MTEQQDDAAGRVGDYLDAYHAHQLEAIASPQGARDTAHQPAGDAETHAATGWARSVPELAEAIDAGYQLRRDAGLPIG